jgi:hypothetical protein
MSASSLSGFQPLDQTNHVRDLATMNDHLQSKIVQLKIMLNKILAKLSIKIK